MRLLGREKKASPDRKAQRLYESGMTTLATEDDPGSVVDAAKAFRAAAESGHVEAMFMLAECNRSSIMYGRSYDEALRWYRAAAEAGHAKATFRLGQMYEEGMGVPQSRLEAGKLYLRAAEKGLPEAQYAYAVLCEEGDCEGDASFWYRKAHENGFELAKDKLA